jgi:hypothetical protein
VLQLDTAQSSNASPTGDAQPLMTESNTDRRQCGNRDSSASGIDESLNFISQTSPEDRQMLGFASEANIQNPEDCLSYNYGEQWGIAEDVTTLDDILSLSW